MTENNRLKMPTQSRDEENKKRMVKSIILKSSQSSYKVGVLRQPLHNHPLSPLPMTLALASTPTFFNYIDLGVLYFSLFYHYNDLGQVFSNDLGNVLEFIFLVVFFICILFLYWVYILICEKYGRGGGINVSYS